jgi:transcriptional regulator with XRE-family HTH domain
VELTRPAELGTFLRSRRARLTPAAVGLAAGGRRRTTGLRREEVAALAGVSAAWYTLLEQGRDARPSDAVLDALARALRLDGAERAHLFRLGRGAPPTRGGDDVEVTAVALRPSPTALDGTPPPLQRLLDAFGGTPAAAVDRCWDLVGRNAALAALFPSVAPARTGPDVPPRNAVHYVLTDPAWRAAAGGDWERSARHALAGLRVSLAAGLGTPATDARAGALLAQLARESPEFPGWWAAHDLWAADRPLAWTYRHPAAGPLAIETTLLDVRTAPGLTVLAFVPGDARAVAALSRLAPPIGDPPD